MYNNTSNSYRSNKNNVSSFSRTPTRTNSLLEHSATSGSAVAVDDKLYKAFEAFMLQGQDPVGDRRHDGVNLTMADMQAIVDEANAKKAKKIKEMEEELERRKANVRAIQAAGKTFKKEQAAEREALKKKGVKLEKQYDKLRVKIDEKTEDCRMIRETLENSHADYIFFEPLLQKLGVNMEKMACSEGKPVHASGVGGTCSVWGCPRLIQEKSDIDSSD